MLDTIWNTRGYINETNPYELKRFFDALLKRCEFSVLGYNEHHFKPHGYTGLWLLGESHFAVHTFVETGRTYIELSSCNGAKHAKFDGILNKTFEFTVEK